MRVAINAMQVRAAKSGVGQYIEGLVDALLADGGALDLDAGLEVCTYCTRENEGNYRRAGRGNYQTRVWGHGEGRKSLRLLNEIMRLGREVSRQRFDLFHGPSNFLPMGLKIPAVVTIHDLSYYVEPERCPPVRRAYWYAMTAHTMRQAHLILADSENTRRDISRFFPKSTDRVRVVGLGIHARFQPLCADKGDAAGGEKPDDETTVMLDRLGLRGPDGGVLPYILSVCTLEPGKNLGLLVQAFERVGRDRPDLRLVLVGDRGWNYGPLLAQIRSSVLRDRILLTGHLPDGDIVRLMQHCRVFAYPSRYEGFGLPPLEALACGAPVVASTGGSLREVLANLPGVIQHEPDDLGGIILGLEQFVDREPGGDVQRLERARAVRHRYDWSRTAEQTVAVWHEAVGCGGGADFPRNLPRNG
jgi:glycosyltransferase involved in cell wall biosynthesis